MGVSRLAHPPWVGVEVWHTGAEGITVRFPLLSRVPRIEYIVYSFYDVIVWRDSTKERKKHVRNMKRKCRVRGVTEWVGNLI